MNIRHKLLLVASAIAMLVAITGGIGWYSKNQTLYLSNIRQAGNELHTLKVRERANMRFYLHSTDPEIMKALEDSHYQIHRELDMWSAAMEYGTGSTEFRSNTEAFGRWRSLQKRAKGLNLTIPHIPRIAEFIRSYELANAEFQNLEREAMKVHRERLATEDAFKLLYPQEKTLRYAVRDAVYAQNDLDLNKTLGLALYYSKEALFQYRDKKHNKLWLTQIDSLATQIEEYDDWKGSDEEREELKATIIDYRKTADDLGAHAIMIKALRARENASLESFDILMRDFLPKWQAQYQSAVYSLTVKKQRQINILLSAAIVAGFIIALLLAHLLAGYFSRRLSHLRDLAVNVGKGNLNTVAVCSSNDEIGELANAFNQMTQDLQSSTISISTLNEEVNERKIAQEDVQKAYQTLEAILSNMPFGVVVVGRDRKVRRVNPAAEVILGAKEADLIGQVCHDHICPAAQNSCPIMDLGQQVDSAERFVLTADGNTVPVIKTVIPIALDNEDVLLEAFADISDLKKVENELRDAKEDLEIINEKLSRERDKAQAASVAKSVFLANMSHEIRTPMNGVIGMSEVLCRSQLDEKQGRYAVQLRSSAKALSSVLNDILDFSKIESGKLDLIISDLDFETFIEECNDQWAERANRKNLDLYFIIDPTLPKVIRADGHQLKQLLGHIINNAIKFTRSGHICIRVSPGPSSNDKTGITFSIEDTGVGIPQDRQDMMFTPFSQVDGSSTRQYGGSGLGLTLAKHLCGIMGGRIQCDSDVGRGSKFSFELEFDKPQDGLLEYTFGQYDCSVCLLVDDPLQSEALNSIVSWWGADCKQYTEVKALIEDFSSDSSRSRPSIVIATNRRESEILEALGNPQEPNPLLRTILIDDSDCHSTCPQTYPLWEGVVESPVRYTQLKGALRKSLSSYSASGGTEETEEADHSIQLWNNCQVLLVEDHRVNQQVAMSVLKKHGLAVDLVTDGSAAIEALREKKYDCVLMDCQMPEMDGYQATHQIRNNTESPVLNRAIPIIALTACATQDAKRECLEAGMDDFLTKPILEHELNRVLTKWLPIGISSKTVRPSKVSSQDNHKDDCDPSIFNAGELLDRILGDKEAMRDILGIFLEDTPELLEKISRSVNESNYDDVQKLSHMLKGSAGNIAGKRVQKLASEIQEAARAEDSDLLSRLSPELERAFNSLREHMKAYLSTMS